MKKVFLSLLTLACISMANAQDVKKVKAQLEQKKIAEAKTMIDQVLTNPKNQKNVEAWYLKGKIYSTIVADNTMRASLPDGRMQALEAIKKALEIDKNQAGIFLTVDNYQPVYVLYTSGFQLGAELYNTEKFEEALTTFKEVGTVGDYIFNQGWGLYKLDTTITYYSALAALNAKKEEEAMSYFRKLADANVGGGQEYSTPYRFLAKYYYDKKDEANMMKYIAAGMALYPKDDYMPLLELDFVREKGDQKALFAKFEEMLVRNPSNYDVCMDYANELFGETHVGDITKKPADYDAKCTRIEALYKKAIEVKPESYDAKLSLGKHYYNQALMRDEESSRVKGTKPEDIKKKADFAAMALSLAEKAIAPLEEVFNHYDTMGKLKVAEKSNFKSACSLLSYCYDKKKDKAKADMYQKKYDDANKAHD